MYDMLKMNSLLLSPHMEITNLSLSHILQCHQKCTVYINQPCTTEDFKENMWSNGSSAFCTCAPPSHCEHRETGMCSHNQLCLFV